MMKVCLDVRNEPQDDRGRLRHSSIRPMITRTSRPVREPDPRPTLHNATIGDAGKVGKEAKLKRARNVTGLPEQRT